MAIIILYCIPKYFTYDFSTCTILVVILRFLYEKIQVQFYDFTIRVFETPSVFVKIAILTTMVEGQKTHSTRREVELEGTLFSLVVEGKKIHLNKEGDKVEKSSIYADERFANSLCESGKGSKAHIKTMSRGL